MFDRRGAYQNAVALALARSDIARNDPSLIARDFTRQFSHLDGEHNVDNDTPCPLTASELIGPDKVNCSLSPGLGGVKDDPRCPWVACVVVSIHSDTWADPVSRQVILSTLREMRYRPDREKVRLAVEVKPRLFQPCIYKELTRGERHFYQPICTNPDATLVILD